MRQLLTGLGRSGRGLGSGCVSGLSLASFARHCVELLLWLRGWVKKVEVVVLKTRVCVSEDDEEGKRCWRSNERVDVYILLDDR